MAPGIYQELIDKDHELRVTIVGNTLFAVRIFSQRHEATKLDWRNVVLGADDHEVVVLDEQLAERLLEFHRRAGLIYGAYDVIIPKVGDPVFLEVNPAGQWMWLENLLEIPISKQLAMLFAESKSTFDLNCVAVL